MNKPKNVVCSTVSDLHKTVFDLIDESIKNHSFLFEENFTHRDKEKFYKQIQLEKIKCVGRLDCDTTGILLFTTNGTFLEKITNPANEIQKVYFVKLRDCVNLSNQKKYLQKIQKGIFLPPEKKAKGFTTKPAKIKWLNETQLTITIEEGHFHEVRRIFFELGNFVQELKRIKIENLVLDNSINQGNIKVISQETLQKFIVL